jgi:hypothetical protein
MATYNVVSGTSQTLGASTVDIVNLSRPADRVTVANTAVTNPIFFTTAGPATGGTPVPAAPTPTVGGPHEHIVLPNSAVTYPPQGFGMIGTVALISTAHRPTRWILMRVLSDTGESLS